MTKEDHTQGRPDGAKCFFSALAVSLTARYQEAIVHRLHLCVATALLLTAQSAHADDDLVLGKKLYVDNCLRCHGAKGGGGVGKRLAGDAAYWDFPIFKRTLMEGIDDESKHMKIMPVWGKTGFDKPKGEIPTDAELHEIQHYLNTFGPAE